MVEEEKIETTSDIAELPHETTYGTRTIAELRSGI
jgi:hypothetical protein